MLKILTHIHWIISWDING